MSQLQGRQRRWLARRGAALALVAAAVAGPFSLGALPASPASADTTTTTAATTTTTTAPTTTTSTTSTTTTSTTTSSTTTTTPTTTTTTFGSPGRHNRRFERQKAAAEQQVWMRVSSLRSLLWKVQRDSFLGADGTTLVTDLQADIAGLKSILSEIQAATDPQDLSTDLQDAYSTIRTYDFVVPVVGLVITIDQVDNVTVPALDAFVTTVQGELGSSNQGTLEPLLADLQAQVTSATTDTSGLSAELLSYTASSWNANHGLLWPAAKDVPRGERGDQRRSAGRGPDQPVPQLLQQQRR